MSDIPGNPKGSRRLAAILAADIAGYSALMGADEAIILPMIGEHGGRIIDTAGDGILAEFASVLGAVKCALAVQKTLAERNGPVEPTKRMQYRIGINQGDVVVDDPRVYGDGVNVAARLEKISEPGHLHIEQSARRDRWKNVAPRSASAQEHRSADPRLSRKTW
jgi:adenylate cyclase